MRKDVRVVERGSVRKTETDTEPERDGAGTERERRGNESGEGEGREGGGESGEGGSAFSTGDGLSDPVGRVSLHKWRFPAIVRVLERCIYKTFMSGPRSACGTLQDCRHNSPKYMYKFIPMRVPASVSYTTISQRSGGERERERGRERQRETERQRDGKGGEKTETGINRHRHRWKKETEVSKERLAD